MGTRIRHSVECPKCLTRYLFSSSPYANGSYLIPTLPHFSDEYALYCSCRKPAVPSRWLWSEVKTCEVSRAAHRRGYGTAEEIVTICSEPRGAWVFDAAKYLNLKSTGNERWSR